MKNLVKLIICTTIILFAVSIVPFSVTDSWSVYASSDVITADLERIDSDIGRWDVRIEAGEKEFGYDTIQGACSNDGYAYMALYNRDKEKIKIAKVDLETMEVVKVSRPLNTIAHGNTLTYNTKIDRIIVVCAHKAKGMIAIFDPKTMKMVNTKKISISKKILKEKFNGMNGISYNSSKNLYVLKLQSKSNKLVLMDEKFKAIKVIKPEEIRTDLLSQGIYTEGNYTYDIQSFRGDNKYNLITVRKLRTGKAVSKIKIRSGKGKQMYELENLFHDGSRWYISFYRANVKKSGDTDRKNYLYLIKNMPFE